MQKKSLSKKLKKEKKSWVPIVMLLLIGSGFLLSSLTNPTYTTIDEQIQKSQDKQTLAYYSTIHPASITNISENFALYLPYDENSIELIRRFKDSIILFPDEGNVLITTNKKISGYEQGIWYRVAECKTPEKRFKCLIKKKNTTESYFYIYTLSTEKELGFVADETNLYEYQ
jgi:hypothetical protein